MWNLVQFSLSVNLAFTVFSPFSVCQLAETCCRNIHFGAEPLKWADSCFCESKLATLSYWLLILYKENWECFWNSGKAHQAGALFCLDLLLLNDTKSMPAANKKYSQVLCFCRSSIYGCIYDLSGLFSYFTYRSPPCSSSECSCHSCHELSLLWHLAESYMMFIDWYEHINLVLLRLLDQAVG